MNDSTPAPAPEPVAAGKSDAPKSIFLVSYPKIVYMYPAWIASLVAGIWMLFVSRGEAGLESNQAYFVAQIFLCVLAINLVVIAFDFPRTTSLTLFFFFIALGVTLWAVFRFNPDILGSVSKMLASLQPVCNSTFYFCFFTMLTLIYIGVLISVQFDYWEVRPNELLHHHGFLSDMERYSAPHLRIEKEINDVFEYFLLRGGRLILHPTQERRAIVLENIFFINSKEDAITKMLSALQVQVRTE